MNAWRWKGEGAGEGAVRVVGNHFHHIGVGIALTGRYGARSAC